MVFYEGFPKKARLVKDFLSNGLFPSCPKVENNETRVLGMLFFKVSLGFIQSMNGTIF